MATMQTILCIPGSWADHREFITSVVGSSDGAFIAAGNQMLSVKDKIAVEFEVCPYDPRMVKSFQIGCQARWSEESAAVIAAHRSVVYLVSDRFGRAGLADLHRFVDACIAAGGLGIKFENSGCAHMATAWKDRTFPADTWACMDAHVMLITGEKHYFSCGMHLFGLPDIAVPGTLENRAACALMKEFNHYHIFERPTFRDGQTFSQNPDAPKFRLAVRDDFIYGKEEHFANPFGRIELKVFSRLHGFMRGLFPSN